MLHVICTSFDRDYCLHFQIFHHYTYMHIYIRSEIENASTNLSANWNCIYMYPTCKKLGDYFVLAASCRTALA